MERNNRGAFSCALNFIKYARLLFRSNSGLGITQVAIAMALTSILLIGINDMLNLATRGTKTSKIGINTTIFMNGINKILQGERACSCIFDNYNPLTFDPTLIGSATPPTVAIPTLDVYDSICNSLRVLADPTVPEFNGDANLQVQSITLQEIDEVVAGTSYTGVIEVLVQDNSTTVTGQRSTFGDTTLRGRFPITFGTSPQGPNSVLIEGCVHTNNQRKESVFRLTYIDATTIRINNASNVSSLRFQMNNGVYLENPNPFINYTIGGLADATFPAPGTQSWIYLYAVPDPATPSQFILIMSARAPKAPPAAGPVDDGNGNANPPWRYLGSFFKTTADQFIRFTHAGDVFNYAVPQQANLALAPVVPNDADTMVEIGKAFGPFTNRDLTPITADGAWLSIGLPPEAAGACQNYRVPPGNPDESLSVWLRPFQGGLPPPPAMALNNVWINFQPKKEVGVSLAPPGVPDIDHETNTEVRSPITYIPFVTQVISNRNQVEIRYNTNPGLTFCTAPISQKVIYVHGWRDLYIEQ